MSLIKSLPIIGVMGSGNNPHNEKSAKLGKWIAQSGYHLLTGAGAGVMSAVSKSFCETKNRQGLSIGIIPGQYTEDTYRPLPGYPNPWIEIPIFTHLPLSGSDGTSPLSRNHINILSAHIIIALPGGEGTKSEIELALKYNKKIFGFFKDSFEEFNVNFNIQCFESFENLTSKN